jgi:hypothetical protein
VGSVCLAECVCVGGGGGGAGGGGGRGGGAAPPRSPRLCADSASARGEAPLRVCAVFAPVSVGVCRLYLVRLCAHVGRRYLSDRIKVPSPDPVFRVVGVNAYVSS